MDERRPTTEGRAAQSFEPKETMTSIRSRAGLAILAAAALFILPAANASAALIETSPCDGATLSQSFARFGDSAYYKLVPGGDFEGTLDGWALRGGAAKGSGSESFGVTGAGASSLTLPAGASATTPAVCVNAGAPTYRFFSRSSGGLLGLLPLMKVELVYRSNLLGLVALPLGTAVPSSSWTPSLPLFTGAIAAGLIDDGVSDLSLRFTSLTGTWRIDDVLVDPAQRG
jgi:hypothetical protein